MERESDRLKKLYEEQLEEEKREDRLYKMLADNKAIIYKIENAESLDGLVVHLNELNSIVYEYMPKILGIISPPIFSRYTRITRNQPYVSWEDKRAVLYVAKSDSYEIVPHQVYPVR